MAVATISVNFATLADIQAGTSTVASINPLQLKNALQSGSSLYPLTVAGLSTQGNLSVTGNINASGTCATGNLTVTGTIFASSGYNGTLDVTGGVRATQDITAYFSDKRLKDIKNNIDGALDKVNKLSGVYYTHNELAKSLGFTDSEQHVGLLAQDVSSVLPEAVKIAPFDLNEAGESKSGNKYLTIQYNLIVPLLVEAVKQLSEKVKFLESEINSKK